MEINYELKPEDFFQFSKENAPTQKEHQPFVLIFLIIYLLFIFADVLYTIFSGSWNSGGSLVVIILVRTFIGFALLLIFQGIIKLIVRAKTQEVLNEPQNGLFCEHRIILFETELLEVTDVNTSRYAWKAIGEIKELESFLVINVLLSSAYIIPKKYFQDREHINKFIETAKLYKQNSENMFQPSHLIEYEKRLEKQNSVE
ncbi:MAG TPA: YcxB family protein [Pyrinomonadaceae bacterium]|nr:YcxB family protein [Pyrinomonadaceae bacterium]